MGVRPAAPRPALHVIAAIVVAAFAAAPGLAGSVTPGVTPLAYHDKRASNVPPDVSILAPSASEGDFGATQGNVWDMAETNVVDIVWRQKDFLVQRRPASEGTVVRGFPGTDVLAMAFYTSSGNNFPASRYHHLTYRMKIEVDADCWTNGRVAYSTDWPDWQDTMVTSYPYVPLAPPMSCPHGTFCIYYMDLARNNNSANGPTWHGADSINDPSSWLTDQVRSFAIVPYEPCAGGGAPTHFDLDFVYLTGDIVARAEDGYGYQFRYAVTDPDSTVVTSTVRYHEIHELKPPGADPACNSSSFNSAAWLDFDPPVRQVVILQPSGPPPDRTGAHPVYLPLVVRHDSSQGGQEHELGLDFSDSLRFRDGKSYYLCLRADDGADRTYVVSSAPVVRVPRSPRFGQD